MTARDRAVAEASRVFRAGVGFSRLWDALVDALTARYAAEEQADRFAARLGAIQRGERAP